MKDRKSVVWRIIHTSAWMRVLIYFVLFALLILIYTIIFHRLYPQLEGTPVDWSQSVLFVIQTITTTGSLLTYHSDEMILISSIMMLSGVIMIFMVIPLILTPYLVAMLRSGPARRTPRALFHHTVIVGNGELSRALVESLSLSDKEVLLVEEDETAARELARKHRHGAFVIWGDYDDPQTWEQAWIKNADFVILCENERTTASIILGIRGLTSARIISIVDKISFDRYLMYAGAEYVLSPKQVTGRILARHAVLNPAGDTEPAIPGLDRLTINKDEFPEKTLRLIHIPVMPESNAAGKSSASWICTGSMASLPRLSGKRAGLSPARNRPKRSIPPPRSFYSGGWTLSAGQSTKNWRSTKNRSATRSSRDSGTWDLPHTPRWWHRASPAWWSTQRSMT